MSNQQGLVNDSSSPRLSVGTGLTWNSPFGPLGIDLGWALIKEDFDETELLRVNFGTRF
jgi:outer membrane protein insertion porin family